MVPGRLLERLNRVLKSKSNHKNSYFGRISVIALGDPAQLPPIKNPYIFIQGQKGMNDQGHKLYMMLTDYNTVILEKIQRTKNSTYIELQENIRNGIFTDKMIENINSRYMGTFPEEVQNDEFHTTVTRTNKNVKKMYEKRAMALSRSMELNGEEPPILLLADIECFACAMKERKNKRKRKRSSSIVLTAEEMTYLDSLNDKIFDNYPMAFFLYIGAQCMITENICTQYQLANGTRGVIVGYQFSDNTTFKKEIYHGIPVRIPIVNGQMSHVRAIYLKITSYQLKQLPPGQPPNLPPNTLAIVRRKHRVQNPIKLNNSNSNKTNLYVNITQIPLRTAEILTPYSIQGSQFTHYTIHDFDVKSFYQLISRGKYGLQSIRLEKKITREFADKVTKNLPFQDEINRLRSLHKFTEEKFKWCE